MTNRRNCFRRPELHRWRTAFSAAFDGKGSRAVRDLARQKLTDAVL
jgi:hypothetical protein